MTHSTKPLHVDILIPALVSTVSKCISMLALELKCNDETIRLSINRLRSSGAIHIDAWKLGHRGPYAPYYIAGSGVDAIKPAAQTNAEKSRRYRESKRGKKIIRAYEATDDRREYKVMDDRARRARRKYQAGGIAAIDPLLAAMMGIRA